MVAWLDHHRGEAGLPAPDVPELVGLHFFVDGDSPILHCVPALVLHANNAVHLVAAGAEAEQVQDVELAVVSSAGYLVVPQIVFRVGGNQKGVLISANELVPPHVDALAILFAQLHHVLLRAAFLARFLNAQDTMELLFWRQGETVHIGVLFDVLYFAAFAVLQFQDWTSRQSSQVAAEI